MIEALREVVQLPIKQYWFYRPSRVFESSNDAAPLPALTMQARQPQTSGQSAPITSQSQHIESEASIDLPQAIVSP